MSSFFLSLMQDHVANDSNQAVAQRLVVFFTGLIKGTLLLGWIMLHPLEGLAIGKGEKVYHTGLSAKSSSFTVSPNGRYLLFNTNHLAHGLRLIDLQSGRITQVPGAPGRFWEMPSWSRDGQQIVAVSTAVREGNYIIGDMQLILIDPRTWRQRTISRGEGVKIFPFFSADGKAVYYFKGQKRERGATPASRYDLYVVDLASGSETRLTHEVIYQVDRGDEDGWSVLFMADGLTRLPSKDPHSTLGWDQAAMYLYDHRSKQLRLLNVDQGSGFFDFSSPVRDRAGNLYFKSAKDRPGGGRFLWFLYRSDPQGQHPVKLAALEIDSDIAIAWATGEIYVSGTADGKVLFRRLAVRAAH